MVKLSRIIVIVFCMNGLHCFAMQQESIQPAQRSLAAERSELFEAKDVGYNESENGSIIKAITRMHSSIMTNLEQLQDRIAARVNQVESDIEVGFKDQAVCNSQTASKNDIEKLDKNIKRIEIIAGAALVLSAIPLAIMVTNLLMKR